MRKELIKKIAIFFFLFNLISSTFAFSFNASISLQENENKVISARCSLESLSAKEKNDLMKLLAANFVGAKIDSNVQGKGERDKLDQNTLIIPVNEKEAVKAELPNQEIEPLEVMHLSGRTYKGAFSFGVVLDDTLRIGRCDYSLLQKDNNRQCPLDGSNLKLRNDDTGLKTIKKPFMELVSDILGQKKDHETLTAEDLSNVRNAFNVPQKLEPLEVPETGEKIEQVGFEERVTLEDEETAESSQVIRRSDLPFIPNTIRSDEFNGFFQTNCSTTACMISVYSLFDKYYNAWFSGSMLLSMGMPALYGGARKLFNFLNIGPESFAAKGLFPFSLSKSEFVDKLRAKFASAETLLGDLRLRRIERLRRTHGELAAMLDPLFEPRGGWDAGYLLTKGTSFRGWFAKDFQQQLAQIAKDSKTKKALYQIVKDLHEFSRAQGNVFVQAQKKYAEVVAKYGLGSAEEQAARIEFGKAAVRAARGYDELRIDIPEWLIQKDKAANLYKYAALEKKFLADGSFANFAEYETKGDAVVLYKAVKAPGSTEHNIKTSDLTRFKTQYLDKAVTTEAGETIPIDDVTKDFLASEFTVGKMVDYTFEPAQLLTPYDFARKYTTGRAYSTVYWEPVRNTQAMLDAIVSKGYMSRSYANILDKALAEQDKLLKDYFSLKGGPKWTAYGYGYDWLKRGFGAEEFSAYQLPEEYKQLKWYHGNDKLYADAFIDFFANAGSDDGDLFLRLINNLPFDLVFKYVSEQFTPTRQPYEKLTGRTLRTKVENLALMSSTNDNCDSCAINVEARNNLQSFAVFFNAPKELKSYMLEETVTKEAQQKGQTLISFAYHMNLLGTIVGSNASSSIDLLQAIKEKNTCADKVNNLGLGTLTEAPIIGKYLKRDPSRIGAILSFGESIPYLLFGWSGVAATMLQQTLIAPKLNDCVDVEGGYYAHIFAPAEKEQAQQGTAAKLSTQKVFDSIKESVNKIFQTVKTTEKDTIVSGAFKKQAEEIEKFVQSNKETVLQATIFNNNHVSGGVEGIKLFSFWFKGESSPSVLKNEGKEQIQSIDGNTSIVYDYKTGKIFIKLIGPDGKEQLIELNSAPDIARMNATNTNIPADELPAKITKFALPSDVNELIFQVDVQGNLLIPTTQTELLNCVQSAVQAQTGLALNSNNLSEAFGKVSIVVTDSHPAINVWSDKKQIIATGSPNQVALGDLAQILIYSKRNTYISDGVKDTPVGLLLSIQTEYGVILVKPETNELIIWLKRNKKAILNQDDVQGLRLKRNDVQNPETLCMEPAFDLEAIAVLGSDLKAEKVRQFNESLQKLGPFQVFETPTKRYIFYSKLMPDGTCQDYFKVIDKETGKTLLDVPIKSLNVTPNGIEIVDDKGNKHSLDFSADNGIPKVSFDGQPAEPLIMAQGRNGSFWFDPEKGTWYAENAHLLPLLEAFREGALTKVAPNGNVTTSASGNNLSVKIGGEQGGFNLPSMPENTVLLILFITSVFFCITIIRIKLRKLSKN